MGRKWYQVGGRRRRNGTNRYQKTSPPTNHSTRVSTAQVSFGAQKGAPVVVSKEQCKSMGAKLSLLPGTGETDPQGSERVTLGTTRASAVGIGCQLIVRRRRHAARLPQWRGSTPPPPL